MKLISSQTQQLLPEKFIIWLALWKQNMQFNHLNQFNIFRRNIHIKLLKSLDFMIKSKEMSIYFRMYNLRASDQHMPLTTTQTKLFENFMSMYQQKLKHPIVRTAPELYTPRFNCLGTQIFLHRVLCHVLNPWKFSYKWILESVFLPIIFNNHKRAEFWQKCSS